MEYTSETQGFSDQLWEEEEFPPSSYLYRWTAKNKTKQKKKVRIKGFASMVKLVSKSILRSLKS